AQDAWAATSPEERGKYLSRLQDAVTARHGEIAKTITAEMGAPTKWAEMVPAGLPIADIATAAQLATTFEFERQIGNSTVVMEPLGVVGCITPWTSPLHQITAKVAYALATRRPPSSTPSAIAPLCP